MSGNPNEFYSQEEKEAMLEELQDRELTVKKKFPDFRRYFVIRRYRDKSRVISMHFTLAAARIAYEQAGKELRDGDLILASADLTTLQATSGGYNRTKW